MRENLILLADSYKVTHHLQYPPDTEGVFSYFESRGGKWPHSLFFGLQYVLKRHLVGQVVTQEMVEEADALFSRHFPGSKRNLFNRAGWEHIVREHGGRLPLVVRAVPEGSLVTARNVLFTVETTDPTVPWLTNYVESILLQTWYPTTVATQSYEQKQVLACALARTADYAASLPFMLHDFGLRGSSSAESAAIGGAAHLAVFRGTDTLPALGLVSAYYGGLGAGEAPGVSVPATEHSTMTAWGKEHELEAVKHVLKEVGPEGVVSVVVDSYDMFNMLENFIGGELKAEVEERTGTLVVRPDSGDPQVIVVQVLDILGAKFGFSTNSKGFKVLPPYVRVIQGDGISLASLPGILGSIESAGWSLENLVFGSGGALLQKVDRDTLKFAYKCSLVTRTGSEMEVFKDPVTDQGKVSKKGRLALVRNQDKTWSTVKERERGDREDQLVTVFKDGEMVREWKWSEVVARVESN